MDLLIIIIVVVVILIFLIIGYNKRKKGGKDPRGDTGTTTSRAVRKDIPKDPPAQP